MISFKNLFLFVNVLYCVSLVNSLSSSLDFIIRCKSSDRECSTKSGQVAWPIVADGIPDLGIAPSEPLTIKSIESDKSGLNIHFKDIVITGLKTCNVLDTTIDPNAMTFGFEVVCKLTVSGLYNISGRVLVLPVSGDGDFKIDLQKLNIKLKGDLAKKTEDQSSYWNIARFNHETGIEGPIVFQFNNLFNGNKQLSDPVHSFVNSNYREVLGELGQPILDTIYKKVMKTANKFLKNLPDEFYYD